MSKQGKRQRSPQHTTQHHKKIKTYSRTISIEVTPEHLIEIGDLQGAVDLLKSYVAQHPTDDLKRRLLGESLCSLKQYKEAVEVLLALQEKNATDCEMIGVAYIQLKRWEQAITWLETSLQYHESAYTNYVLAFALIREEADDPSWEHVTDVKKIQRAVDHLQSARTLPECPGAAYLLLNTTLWSLACHTQLQGKDEREQEVDTTKAEGHEVIKEAFALYPDDEWIRLEFAEDLVEQQIYETALLVLAPLMDHESPRDEFVTQKAVAYAITASIGANFYEKALHYIELFPLSPPDVGKPYHPNVLKLKGDLLLYQEKLADAQTCYEQEIQSHEFLDQFIGFFSNAWVLLLQDNWDQGRRCAQQASHLWFQQKDEIERICAIDNTPTTIGTTYISHIPGECIEHVCKRLLLEDDSLETELRGQLSYLLYKYNGGYHLASCHSDEWEAEQFKLLQQAAKLYPHTLIISDLAVLFLEMGDMPQAVKHYLLSLLSLYNSSTDDFDEV